MEANASCAKPAAPRPFVQNLHGQIELAMRILVREGLLTPAVWAEARAAYLVYAQGRPDLQARIPPIALADAIAGPGLDWLMVANIAERLRERDVDPSPSPANRPGSPVEAALNVLWAGLYLIADEIEGASDPDDRDAVVGTLGAANEVLRGDHHGYLNYQRELADRREQATSRAVNAAEAAAAKRKSEAEARYRILGAWLAPIVAAARQKQSGRGLSQEAIAKLAEDNWPEPGLEGFYQGGACQPDEYPPRSTLMTAIKFLDRKQLLDRGSPPRGRRPKRPKGAASPG